MLYREWKTRDIDVQKSAALAAATGAGRLLCDVLVARGIDTREKADEMLHTDAPLPDPFLMKDMDKAARRIHAAIQNEETIAVFGDYDVDGITATALLYSYLEEAGAEVYYKLPNRNSDSYGLSPALVNQMADVGVTLIITVDNGTTAFEAAEAAIQRGVSVVVTDHHLPYDTLPEVEALVNPCRADDESGLSGLSGVGVAFMLVSALEGGSAEEMLPLFGELVAIGTVADVMKLVGVNRTLVKHGLALLNETQRCGLRALLDSCGFEGKPVSVENISYGLAPRLNAAGRMDDATMALQLLLADDEEEAQLLAQQLQQQNAARQKAEQEILALIDRQLEEDPQLQKNPLLVLWGDGWHGGVIGIVASRLVDRYAKPVIIISFDGDEGRGSGRSAGGFSLHGAISSCEDILIRYGGHDLAAGFSLHRDNVKEFRRRVNEWALQNRPFAAAPVLWADAQLTLDTVSVEQVQQLESLAPCGSGNPVPRFLAKGLTLEAVYPVGGEGRHSRLRLRQNGAVLYAVLFGTSPAQLAYGPGDTVDAVLVLSLYSGKNGPQISARIEEVRPAGMGSQHVAQSMVFANFFAGIEADDDERAALVPTREEAAAVYRTIRDGGEVYYSDLRPAILRLGEGASGHWLTALAALEELGLVAKNEETGRYEAPPQNGKKDLAQSRLLQRLGYA